MRAKIRASHPVAHDTNHQSESIRFAADPMLRPTKYIRDTRKAEREREREREGLALRAASKPETRMRFREIAQTWQKKVRARVTPSTADCE